MVCDPFRPLGPALWYEHGSSLREMRLEVLLHFTARDVLCACDV